MGRPTILMDQWTSGTYTGGLRGSNSQKLREAYIRRASDCNAVGRSRLHEPREGAEMASLALNFERANRRERELRLMMHTRLMPLASGRNAARLSLLDNSTQRYLADARSERKSMVDAIKADIHRTNAEEAGIVFHERLHGNLYYEQNDPATQLLEARKLTKELEDDAIALFKGCEAVMSEVGSVRPIELGRQMEVQFDMKKKYGSEKWGVLSEHMYGAGLWGEVRMNEWVDVFVRNFSTEATSALLAQMKQATEPAE